MVKESTNIITINEYEPRISNPLEPWTKNQNSVRWHQEELFWVLGVPQVSEFWGSKEVQGKCSQKQTQSKSRWRRWGVGKPHWRDEEKELRILGWNGFVKPRQDSRSQAYSEYQAAERLELQYHALWSGKYWSGEQEFDRRVHLEIKVFWA